MIVVDEIYKADWPQGEWQRENDIYIWTQIINDYTYYCIALRLEMTGALNGYVGIDNNHFLFKMDYSCKPMTDIEVHGGLTFSTFSEMRTQLINEHLTNEFDKNDIWWFGFDCGHSDDYMPYLYGVKADMPRYFTDEMVYRNKDYVIKETNDLVLQLSNLQVKYDTYIGNKQQGVGENEPRAREELFKDE